MTRPARPDRRALERLLAAVDAEVLLRTGASCRSAHQGSGRLAVELAGRAWPLLIEPRTRCRAELCYHATDHFRIALRGEPAISAAEQKLLRAYARALGRRDAELRACWPGSGAPASGEGAEGRTPLWTAGSVRRAKALLEGYVPFLSAADLHPDKRTQDLREQAGHYELALRFLLSRAPARRDRAALSVLEVGCSYGLFLDLLSPCGLRGLTGIDIDPEAVRCGAGHGLDVRQVDARDLPASLPPAGFDLAFAIQFFNYGLRRGPGWRGRILGFFAGVRACLKPGGVFFCDAELPLPVADIESSGLRARQCLLRTKPHPLAGRAPIRDDVWAFVRPA